MKPMTQQVLKLRNGPGMQIGKTLALGGLALGIICQGNVTALGQSVTLDKLHGYAGVVSANAKFSQDTPTGAPGDYSIDFGISRSSTYVLMTNVAWMVPAFSNDVFTVSFWLKKYPDPGSSPAAGSPVWIDSTNTGRAFQIHCPWSDDNVYFDTSGCCDGTAQRISASITTFPGYAAVGDDSWWTTWHHWVVMKNGQDKQIWIDGTLFLEGTSTNPLPTDIYDIWLGVDGPGHDYMQGKIDDFAAYATALPPADITSLSQGTKPDKLPTSDQLLAYWDFNDPPAIGTAAGTPLGFSLPVYDIGTNVLATNSIQLSLNGSAVTPTSISKSGSITAIGYTVPTPPLVSGSTNTVSLSVMEGANNYSSTQTFVVPTFATVPPSLALAPGSVNTANTGFDIKTYAVDAVPGNGVQVALNMLAGAYGPNVADLSLTNGQGYFVWTDVLNFDINAPYASDNPPGDFENNYYSPYLFPGIPSMATTNSPNENFSLAVYTALQFSKAGLYEMGVNSDDSFATFTGPNPYDLTSAVELGQFSGGRGSADTFFQFYVTQPGFYGFLTAYEQGGGGANLEWFSVQPDGTEVLINDVTNAFTAYQWVPTITAPYLASVTPAAKATGVDPDVVIQARIADGTSALDTNTVSMQLDGANVTPSIVKSNSNTIVSYTPSPLFASLSTHTVALNFGAGAQKTSYSWSFTVAELTKDKLHGYFGELQGAAAFTPNGGGHTGMPGDYAIDFGKTTGGDVYVNHTLWVDDEATTNDSLAVSFWVKKYDIAASSAFWFDSPSSSGHARGFQGHTPWSNDNIYFDTAGCCAAGTERISASITTFPPYAAVGNDSWWNSWHHFVFDKNGPDTKEIWIDGQLFWSLAQAGTGPIAVKRRRSGL